MTARAFTNVHKHFSLSPCVSSLYSLLLRSTTCRRCQILRELRFVKFLAAAKRSYDLGACQILIKELRLWQLHLRLSIFMQLRICVRAAICAVKFLQSSCSCERAAKAVIQLRFCLCFCA